MPSLRGVEEGAGVSVEGNEAAVRRAYEEIKRGDLTFPDLRYDIEELVAEGDGMVTRWRMAGTHEGANSATNSAPHGATAGPGLRGAQEASCASMAGTSSRDHAS